MFDLEIDKESPAESKQIKLARSINREVVDKELKPNATEKRQIQARVKLYAVESSVFKVLFLQTGFGHRSFYVILRIESWQVTINNSSGSIDTISKVINKL